MKYTKEQRLDIGRRIYNGEINKYQAAEYYDISWHSARNYASEYRVENSLPPKNGRPSKTKGYVNKIAAKPNTLETYEEMSKEELIKELVKSRIAEARLKKGYEVKGDGSIIQYSKKNTK